LAKLDYTVVGIDYSKYQLSYAIKNSKSLKSVKYLRKNVNKFNFKKKFDAAICMWSTLCEEPIEYEKAIRNIYNSLKTEGIFIVDSKNWENIARNEKIHIENLKAGNYHVKWVMRDRYTGNFRIRETLYSINGKRLNDICITRTLGKAEFIAKLKKAGFKIRNVCYDFNYKPTNHAERIQIIAQNSY